jgi:hypothetical protein
MRTESKTMQVHPNDEQYYIDIMEEFHWNLKSTQEIKTKDSHLENRGGELYNVTESEHYIKLAFERPYDFPNRDEIVRLENEFFSMVYDSKGGYKTAIIVTLIAAVILGLAVNGIIAILALAGGGFWIYSINKNNSKKQQTWELNNKRRKEILEICGKITSH